MRVASLAVVVASCLGCGSQDAVLPDRVVEPECGNGVVEPGEECDVDAPACVGCIVAPNWTCSRSGCARRCGDGVVGEGDGGSCASPRRDTACDMTGYWAARETDATRDTIVGALQTASTWYLYRFVQSGSDFSVVEDLECGVRVTGSATVEETPGTLRAMIYENRMDSASPHGPRRGRSTPTSGGCAVSFDRWYEVRGALDRDLPADFASHPTLSSLPPLPSTQDPTGDGPAPDGATDPDGDGFPGVAYLVTGFVSGVRDAVQRDWKEFASDVDVPASAVTFAIPGAFDLEENVLHVSECDSACALVGSKAEPARDVRGKLTLSFIGRTFGSERVSEVVVAPPRARLESDLTTCARVRLLLPHDPSLL